MMKVACRTHGCGVEPPHSHKLRLASVDVLGQTICSTERTMAGELER